MKSNTFTTRFGKGELDQVNLAELETVEGGILPLIYGVAFGLGMAIGYGATKGGMEGGGGEVLPVLMRSLRTRNAFDVDAEQRGFTRQTP